MTKEEVLKELRYKRDEIYVPECTGQLPTPKGMGLPQSH